MPTKAELEILIRQSGQQILDVLKQKVTDLGKASEEAAKRFGTSSQQYTAALEKEMAATNEWYAVRMAGQKAEKAQASSRQVQITQMQELAEGIRTATADFKAGIITAEIYATALKDTRIVALELRQEMGQLAGKDLVAFNQVMTSTTPKVQNFSQNSFLLRNALALVGAEAIGATSVMGRLAAGFLLFGTGSTLSLGIIATLAAVAFWYNRITKESRDTDEQIRKTTKSLADQEKGNRSPQQIRSAGVFDVLRTQVEARQGLKDIEQTRIDAVQGSFIADMINAWNVLTDKEETLSALFAETVKAYHAAVSGAIEKEVRSQENLRDVAAARLTVQQALVKEGADDAKIQEEMDQAADKVLAKQKAYTDTQAQRLLKAEAETRLLERQAAITSALDSARKANIIGRAGLHAMGSSDTGSFSSALASTPVDILTQISLDREHQASIDDVTLAYFRQARVLEGLTAAQVEARVAEEKERLENERAAKATQAVIDQGSPNAIAQRRNSRRTGLRTGADSTLRNAAAGALAGVGEMFGNILGGQEVSLKKTLAENAAAVRDLDAAFAAGKINIAEYQMKLAELADEKKLALSRANPLRRFAATMTATLGVMLTELGRALIAFGLAGEAIKKFITNPIVAIAAGVTLVALGTALSHKAASIADAGGASLAGGGSLSSSGFSSAQDSLQKGEAVIYIEGPIVLDPNDTGQMDRLARALNSLSGRNVIIRPLPSGA